MSTFKSVTFRDRKEGESNAATISFNEDGTIDTSFVRPEKMTDKPPQHCVEAAALAAFWKCHSDKVMEHFNYHQREFHAELIAEAVVEALKGATLQ